MNNHLFVVCAVLSICFVAVLRAAAVIGEVQLSTAGGTGGTAWDDKNYADVLNRRLSQIVVFSGKWVDSIQLSYEGGHDCPKHGGDGGTRNVFSLEPDEFVTKILVRYGTLVEQIQFCTTMNRCSPAYGSTSNGNGINAMWESKGRYFGYFRGRSASMVDALTPVFLDSPPAKYLLNEIQYDLSSIRATNPITLGSASVRNLSSRDQVKGLSVSYSKEFTRTWSHVTSFTAGVSTTVTASAGVPLLAEVSISTTTFFSSTYTFTWGQSVRESITGTVRPEVTVPPCTETEVIVEARSAEVDVPFTAVAIVMYQNGRNTTERVSGRYTGILVFDAVTQFGKEIQIPSCP